MLLFGLVDVYSGLRYEMVLDVIETGQFVEQKVEHIEQKVDNSVRPKNLPSVRVGHF